MPKLDMSGVTMEIPAEDLANALGLDPATLRDTVLLAMSTANWEWVAQKLVDEAQLVDRVLLKMNSGNWNYAANQLWQPNGALMSQILQWLRSNPTTGIH